MKKNAMTKKIILALTLLAASTVVSANLVPGIGAQAIASDNFAVTGSSCVTDFLIPMASCSYGGASASATVSNGTTANLGDITVQATGNNTGISGVMAGGIIQDTLSFQGNIPANGRGKIEMTATGTLSGSAYASEDLWVGGFNVSGLLTPGNMIQGAVVTGNIQNTCYDPGISSSGSPYGITLCVFSDGHNLGISWDFPLSSVASTGLEFRALLECIAAGAGQTCNYQDPFTITLPAGVTFTSAANQLAPVPVPTAAWLFGSGLLGLIGVARRKQ